MSTIPKDVLDKIEEYIQRQKHLVSSEGMENIRTDCLYGYQLATDGREELEKECEELKTSGWKEGYIKQSKQIEELKAENERLKGLVKTQFFKYYDDAFQEHIWEEYAKENNL